MTTAPELDEAKVEAFMGRVIGDLGGAWVSALCSLGDRLGLFRDLAARGPATSAELAARAGVNERYAREWASGLYSAGYLTYDAATRRFTLPPEHVPALAQEAGPMCVGGPYAMLPAMFAVFEPLVESFRHGGGVPQSAYGAHCWCGLTRFTNSWFENWLVPVWLEAMPTVKALIEGGGSVADIGCGQGLALIKLAKTFPNATYTGYDLYAPSVADATRNAEAAGVADRVRFVHLDAAHGLPEQYDVITTFDVIHDSADPKGLLRSIRQALRPGGRYVLVDVKASEKLEENVGPLATLCYGSSVFYCMTTSLAQNGAGLGTMGMPDTVVRALCAEAGFGEVRLAVPDQLINTVYEIAL